MTTKCVLIVETFLWEMAMVQQIRETILSVRSFLELEQLLLVDRKKLRRLCDANNIDYSHFKIIYNTDKLIGSKHNLLKIEEVYTMHSENKSRKYAKCICECGMSRSLRLDQVINGHTKSCGCLSKRRQCMDGSKNPAFKGIGDMPMSWFRTYEESARKRNIQWNITLEDAWNKLQEQHGLCALTGQTLHFGRIRSRLETNASIDRIDSTKGYEINNIQIVEKSINLMKSTFTQDDFIKNCKLVACHF